MLNPRMFLSGAIALLAIALTQTGHGGPTTNRMALVEAGYPKAAILASKEMLVSERFAVQELQTFIEQISGTRLPVFEPGQTPPSDQPELWVIVGKATARQRHNLLQLDDLGTEGFVIKTIGNDLVIAGGEKRGTLYGVYTFLESLGCRWWSDEVSTIPKLRTIVVSTLDRREKPRFEYRDLLYQERWAPTLFGVRNKLTNMTGGARQIPEEWGGSGPVFQSSLVHSWKELIKLDGSLDYENKAGKAKPEWYALIKDWQGKPLRSTVQPCTRNPEVRLAILQGALKLLRQHPDDLFVTVGQEDGPDYCHCSQYGCAELVAREGSASALVLELANEAADAVEKEFPGKRVMAPAYMWSLKLPKTLRPRENVIISLAPIDNDFGHPLAAGTHPQNVACRAALEEWETAARRIWLWDYTCNFTHYLMPHPNLDVLGPNIRFYADHHVTGYLAQGSHTCVNAEFSHLRMWVLAKALWNPAADNKSLIAEFCSGYYGAAGPAILKYIGTIHRPVRQQEQMYVSCYNDFTSAWLSPEVLTEAEGYMREAETAVVGDPALRDRVRLAHIPLQYVLAVRQPSSGTWKRIEEKFGIIDRGAFASSLADRLDQFFVKTGKPWGMDETGGRSFQDFIAYLRQWAAKAGPKGDVTPPELQGIDNYRIIHPWQIEQQKLNWGNRPFADAEASDGWAMRAKDEGWAMGYSFVAGDDFRPGKRYTLYVRVKCPQPTSEGDAFAFGIYGKEPLPSLEKRVPVAALQPGKYQTIEAGALELRAGHSFWIALVKGETGYAVPEVRLDCFWLREVP